MFRYHVFTLMLIAGIAGHSRAESAENVVRELYRRWSGGDHAHVLRLWTTDSRAERAAALLAMEGCVSFENVHVESMETAGGARVLVEAIVTRNRGATRKWRAYSDPHRAIVDLEHRGDGWLIVDWRHQEELLLDKLVTARTNDERRAILDGATELQTPLLIEMLCDRAITESNRHEFEAAQALLSVAQELSWQNDDRARAEVLSVKGVLLRVQPPLDKQKALSTAAEAVNAAAEADDPDVLARALQRLGRAHRAMGEEADPIFQRALDLADDLVDATPAALAATQLAMRHEIRGNYRVALDYGNEAISLSRRTDSPSAFVNAGMVVGGIYLALGDPRLARLHWEQALTVARREGFRLAVSELTAGLGMAAMRSGDLVAAKRWTKEAFDTIDATSDPRAAKHVLENRVWIAMKEGRFVDAEADAVELMECAESEIPGSAFHVAPLIAMLNFASGHLLEAMQWLEVAEGQAASLTGGELLACLMLRARIHEARGAIHEAVCDFKDAVELGEKRRSWVGSGIGQQSNLVQELDAANRRLVALLVQLGHEREAYLHSERMRARFLRDALAGRRQTVRAEMSMVERAHHVRLTDEIQSLNRALIASPQSSPEWKTTRRMLARARLELEDFENRYASDREGAAARAINDLSGELPSLPRGDVLLSYTVLESSVIVMILKAGANGRTTIRAKQLPVMKSNLVQQVHQLVEAIEQRSLRYRKHAEGLYRILLDPIDSFLRGSRRVTIVPDGVLWQVPFHALRSPEGKFLVEDLAVSYAPAAGFLNRSSTQPPSAHPRLELLALADPEAAQVGLRSALVPSHDYALLPHAVREVQEVGALYDQERTDVRIGSLAQEDVLKRKATLYRILHIATHGISDQSAPLFSALLLAPGNGEDGLLEVREIIDLQLNADLAILSACETAKGPLEYGEGRISLSWAFLLAGCSTTIVSQWKAGSESAAALMVALHHEMQTDVSPAEALRQAQLKMIRSSRHAHPFYWAAFALIGGTGEMRPTRPRSSQPTRAE